MARHGERGGRRQAQTRCAEAKANAQAQAGWACGAGG